MKRLTLRIDHRLLYGLLDSQERNNTILVNSLRAVPDGALEVCATPDSPCIAQVFTRLHFVRLVFVLEDALEFALPLPDQEWLLELDRERIVAMLMGSALVVRGVVFGRLERWMESHDDHRMLFLQP